MNEIPKNRSPAPSGKERDRANQIGALGCADHQISSSAAPATQESDAVPIGRFQKNSREVLRAELRHYRGHDLADFRLMALANTVELPTKAGFSIRIEQLPDLADLVGKALAEARARGLLVEASGPRRSMTAAERKRRQRERERHQSHAGSVTERDVRRDPPARETVIERSFLPPADRDGEVLAG